MFGTDTLDKLNFVLEFNLPKDISDNQEHINLSVHHIDVPVVETTACPIGCIPTSTKVPGEICCLDYYQRIKDVLQLINKWVNSVHSTCSKLPCSRSDLFVEAKLYAYKNNGSLFKKWQIEEFYPLFNPNAKQFSDDIQTYNGIEIIFRFKNINEESLE